MIAESLKSLATKDWSDVRIAFQRFFVTFKRFHTLFYLQQDSEEAVDAEHFAGRDANTLAKRKVEFHLFAEIVQAITKELSL